MEALRDSGLDVEAYGAVERATPFLGICVGMQLLYEKSDEDPGVPGLGILPGPIRRLPEGVKVPQMQWNTLQVRRPSPLLEGIGADPWMYFVHSYAAEDDEPAVAMCDYGGPVVAMVERDRLWATQFHPEKSGDNGLRLLGNFVALCQP
jgi:glutamine amidotransferase